MSKIAISAFFAGVVCKMYDDLVDNPKLHKYKTEFLLELLKGLHYILFTFVSINEPIFFLMFCVSNTLYNICDKKAYHNPYENSVLYSFLSMFLLIDYNNFNINKLKINFVTVYVVISYFSFFILDSLLCKSEIGILKIISRTLALIWSLLIVLLFQNKISCAFINVMFYNIGYLFISIMVQSYSLITNSNNNITPKEKNTKRKKYKKKETVLITNIRILLKKIVKFMFPKQSLNFIKYLDNYK